MDVFKLIQFVMALIHFVIVIIVLSVGFIVSGNDIYSLIFWYGFDPHNYIFIVVSQLTWLNMYLHIREYREMHNGKTYEQVKAKVKMNENYIAAIMILLYVVIASMLMIITILQYGSGWKSIANIPYDAIDNNTWRFSFILQKIMFYSRAGIFCLFVFLVVFFYFILLKAMKKNLNYYYRKKYRDLTTIMIVGFTWLGLSIVIDCINYFLLIELDAIDYFRGGERNHTLSEKVAFVIMRIIQESIHLFYIFYFVRNIDFTQYVIDILSGYRIDAWFHCASRFITKGIVQTERSPTKESLFQVASIEEEESSRRCSTEVQNWRSTATNKKVDNTYKENYERFQGIEKINRTVDASKINALNSGKKFNLNGSHNIEITNNIPLKVTNTSSEYDSE